MDALHAVRDPWGVSAHDAQEALVELGTRTPPPTCHVRLGSRDLAGMSRPRAVELGRRLRDAAGLGAWTRDGDDPWFGARILSGDDASRALDITTKHSTSGLDDAARQLNRILSESHVPEANSLEDWKSAFATMSSVRETLEVFRPEVFDIPLKEHIAATATRDWREARDVEMGWLDRWKIRQQTKRLLRPGRPPANLHEELVSASEQREHWFELVGGGGRPEISPRLDEGLALLAGLTADLEWLDERLQVPNGQTLTSLPLRALRERLAALASRPDRIAVLPQVTTALDELRAAGLGPVVDDLAARGIPTDQVTAEVEHVWWASLAAEITVRDPAYGAHDGEGLRRDVAEFAEADRAHLAATVARVRAAVARNVREVLADHPAHEALVRAEAGKARRHRPLRDLMPQAGTTLTAIKPCWAMSPLVVASTLPPGRWFDVVIFDEASQVQPAQAISAISRARQVVVAGDERQLPPTNFFTVVSDDEADAGAPTDETLTEGFESVLDVLAAALPTRNLTWHYRSRDERLIAFANEAMYDGRLTTFPGTSLELGRHLRAGRRAGRRAARRRHHRDDRRGGGSRRRARPRARAHPAHRVARCHRPRHQARRPARGGDHRGAAHVARRSPPSSTSPRGALLRQEPRTRAGRRARRHHPVDRLRQDAPRSSAAPLRTAQHRGRRASPQRRHHPGPLPDDRRVGAARRRPRPEPPQGARCPDAA